MSNDLFEALYGASENIKRAVLYAMEHNLKVPGLAEGALELSQALCLLCPRPARSDDNSLS